MPILDIQKRARELGRIRTGHKASNGAPTKLSQFRLTSASKPLLEKVAELYGGEVRQWTPAGGAQQWEVYTEADRIPIMVPPQPVSQWYETWTAGGCVHRCDGETDYISGEACDPESDLHQQSKPTTRLNVVLRDVEGIGVWRLESHGWNAALELPQAAEFLAQAGGYVEGWVALEERVSKAIINGKAQTRKFLVPIIEIGVTPAQLMAGEGRVATPAMEGPVQRPALPSGKAEVPDYLAQAQAAHSLEAVQQIWRTAHAAGHLTEQLAAELKIVGDSFAAATAPPGPDADGAFEAEVVDEDADAVWQQVLAAAGKHGLSLEDTTNGFAQYSGGVVASTATAAELRAYLDHLQSEQVPA